MTIVLKQNELNLFHKFRVYRNKRPPYSIMSYKHPLTDSFQGRHSLYSIA